MKAGIELDYETADRITLLTLQEQLNYLKEELRLHQYEGQYMHPGDKLILALELLIDYYGG